MTPDADQRRKLLRHPAGWIATGFGSGLAPVAPGTAGTLAALVPWLLLRELALPYYAAVVLVAFVAGIWACGWVVAKLNIEDPGFAVWDEFVGLWLALAPLLWRPRGWLWICGGFILFRLFDIWKPWPVSWADRNVGGGLGVMLDDAFAGACAAAVLAALLYGM